MRLKKVERNNKMAIYRYKTIPKGRSEKGRRVQTTSIPPSIKRNINDIYIYTRVGDRLDNLADYYYGDRTKWTFLAAANDLYEMVCPVGIQLRIPNDKEEVRQQWIKQNQDR
jgi:hypothetical protein